MYRVLELTQDDFRLHKVGVKELVMGTPIQGLSMVVFYSHACRECAGFLPTFAQLPRLIHGCQFAALNVSSHSNVLRMSERTIAPIREIPYIVLYYNGLPRYRYMAEYMIQPIKTFIMNANREIAESLLRTEVQRGNTSAPAAAHSRASPPRDEYDVWVNVKGNTLSIPVYGSESTVSYIEMDEMNNLEILTGPTGRFRVGRTII